MIEFFAGKAQLSTCMKAAGYRTASFDILFEDGRLDSHNSNFMDINSPSGFAYFVFKGCFGTGSLGDMCEDRTFVGPPISGTIH